MNKERKELLCIHYYYPPIKSGGVIRNYYFSRAFGDYFRHVHVITTANVHVMDQEILDIPPHISTYPVATKDYRSVIRTTNHLAEARKDSWPIQFILKLKKTLPFHFWIGEGGPIYLQSAYRQAVSIISRHNITHIYSSFMPYADHKIASRIKRKFPHLVWIADFRDLQVEPIYNNIFLPKLNMLLERQILQSADLITTVSEGLATALRKIHSHVISVPRGIELRSQKYNIDRPFTISYTGNLFQNYRDGAFFVRALANFIQINYLTTKDLCFTYAGRDSATWTKWIEEAEIESYFIDRGFISRRESLELQEQSNALLMLSSSSTEHQGVLTGKLFEYLETPIPIINVIQGSYDHEFEQLFRQLDAGKIIYTHQEDVLITYIDNLYRKFAKRDPWQPSEQGMSQRKKWNWTARAKQILDAI